jgi:ParB-like chromosome segregation protein Spo0J
MTMIQIIAGHGRLETAKQLNMKTVPNGSLIEKRA